MFKKIEIMITLKNIIQFQNKKALLFILFVFQLGFANALSLKEDSLSAKYSINDPRNPNCPCLKYQKLADDEFNKLFGKGITVNSDKNRSNYTNSFAGNSDGNLKSIHASKKIRIRNNFFKIFDLKKKRKTKRTKVRRLRRDNTACYHF
jgi:hypothetical protein